MSPIPTSSPNLYSSFLPIPLLLSSCLPGVSSTFSTHYIYVRPNRPSHSKQSTQSTLADTTSSDRTIFLCNLPVDMTDRHLRLIFQRWGVLESITLSSSSTGDILESVILADEEENFHSDSDSDSDSASQSDHVESKDNNDVSKESKYHNDIDTTAEDEVKNKIPELTFINSNISRREKRRKRQITKIPSIIPLPNPPRPFGKSGLRTAHITFLSNISLNRLFSSSPNPIQMNDYLSSSHHTSIRSETRKELQKRKEEMEREDGDEVVLGLNHYLKRYNSSRPNLSLIKVHADSALDKYDHLHSLLLSSRARKRGAGALVDDEGFTVVVRGGRHGRTGGEMGVGVVSQKGNLQKFERKKKLEVVGEFYKFQRTDKRRQELAGLRKQFESDKARVEEMRNSKRLKPY
ncbi:hypothetical protein TREMEDRAFT_63629 [Tremella mesenterica DSM 1558]|uniref:uncharacterized protein n=1 Tax=Tremella mesenterica (strain ATCC 24925 / CBS 8224 / DSM 1558 / NBRC 9311 / NRRL Y-6157 / RJB 2259-6 / UBC 559-6) TaxID=578456 RepID=UPI0003F49575|nr:uncharacterized protein TREMEDRAFT_63629 [Tremella mesenterica DSM 1558]EIW68461.1 hypothetical protein TREMEDRAFT_63629 [Tremella mesenterica DSM 1558]